MQIPSFDGSDLLFSLNMLFYSFFLKLIPCVALTVLTASLIRAMYQVGIFQSNFFIIYKPIFWAGGEKVSKTKIKFAA